MPEDDEANISAQDLNSIFSVVLVMISIVTLSTISLKWIEHFQMLSHAIRHNLKIGVFVGWWYTLSLLFVLMNKWIVAEWKRDLKLPVLMSTIHMIVKGIVAGLIMYCGPKCAPQVATNVLGASDLTLREFLTKSIVTIGICTGIDIGFSNWSFVFITVSSYTILKSGMLLLTFIFSVALGLEKCGLCLLSSCIAITAGIAMASYGDPDFDIRGCVLLIVAMLAGAGRWVATQWLVKDDDDGESKTVRFVALISPSGALALLPLALILEGRAAVSMSSEDAGSFALVALGGGLLSFALVSVEIYLCTITSAMSLSVFGVTKSMIQIFLGALIFHDRLTPSNITGIAVTTVGVLWYNALRHADRALVIPVKSSIEIHVELPTLFGHIKNAGSRGRYAAVEMQSDF